jgi:hypothetical protein
MCFCLGNNFFGGCASPDGELAALKGCLLVCSIKRVAKKGSLSVRETLLSGPESDTCKGKPKSIVETKYSTIAAYLARENQREKSKVPLARCVTIYNTVG